MISISMSVYTEDTKIDLHVPDQESQRCRVGKGDGTRGAIGLFSPRVAAAAHVASKARNPAPPDFNG